MTIASAGYVIVRHGYIWGSGATSDEAWACFRNVMDQAGVAIVDDDGPGAHLSDYDCVMASLAMLTAVDRQGGVLPWTIVNDVACTIIGGRAI